MATIIGPIIGMIARNLWGITILLYILVDNWGLLILVGHYVYRLPWFIGTTLKDPLNHHDPMPLRFPGSRFDLCLQCLRVGSQSCAATTSKSMQKGS